MKEPVDHILRPQLPWRSPGKGVTECGYDATKVKTLRRDEFFIRLKEYGKQRTAMVTCMTCADTAQRWATWDQEPRQALEREITWEGARFHSCAGSDRFSDSGRGQRLKDELLAIADLIETHREEFDHAVLVRELRREWIDKKFKPRMLPKRQIGGL